MIENSDVVVIFVAKFYDRVQKYPTCFMYFPVSSIHQHRMYMMKVVNIETFIATEMLFCEYTKVLFALLVHTAWRHCNIALFCL